MFLYIRIARIQNLTHSIELESIAHSNVRVDMWQPRSYKYAKQSRAPCLAAMLQAYECIFTSFISDISYIFIKQVT